MKDRMNMFENSLEKINDLIGILQSQQSQVILPA
jgi:hypothetical protein